jgi:ribosome biogenesis GTPase
MTRDYSRLLPAQSGVQDATDRPVFLTTLGWQPYFSQQVDMSELAQTPPVRIVEVRRNGLHVLGDGIDEMLSPRQDATVGDWLLFDHDNLKSSRVLARKSLIKRRAPGKDRQEQLIAANIDTAFIVTSCNQDFNIARLERYVAATLEAHITPVIVLTKTDMIDDPKDYVARAKSVSVDIAVVALDAKSDEPKTKLAEWCKPGATVAFLGSSGVGKSTLANSLLESQSIATQSIREDDAKGRHTTTRRQLHIMSNYCIILDTPGMRELQLTDAASGIEDLFSDIRDLSDRCRFRNCQHETEPGCAVLNAVKTGEIDLERLARWRKLAAEDAFNSATLLERKSKEKAFGRMVRTFVKQNDKRK